jgi:hypothetical protein
MDALLKFFAELSLRFFSKTPWFFKVVQLLSIAVALILGLPQLLADAGVTLPPHIEEITSEVVFYAGIIAAFIAQLTVTTEVKEALPYKD